MAGGLGGDIAIVRGREVRHICVYDEQGSGSGEAWKSSKEPTLLPD